MANKWRSGRLKDIGTGTMALGFSIVALVGCERLTPRATPGLTPVARVFRTDKLAEIDATILEAITNKLCPGGVLWLERNGVVYKRAYGWRALVPEKEPMTIDTIFDVASLTKVVATTPAVMLLVERGQLQLDEPVCAYIPELSGGGKEKITLRQLLTHTSGLSPDVSLKPDWSGMEAFLRLVASEPLQAQPGQKFIYSDTGMILAGEIVRRRTGRTLDRFVNDELYKPLGMRDTCFNPPPHKLPRIAPTTVEDGKVIRGIVHDPRARRLNGVAGHAGLFTTAADLARFARMMLDKGRVGSKRILSPATVDLMTIPQTPPHIQAMRGLGWDIDSPYSGQRGTVFPKGGYGHTGWTGTSLWIDPFSQTFVIFLSNRNHPDEKGNVVPLRRKLGTLAAEAVIGFNFVHVPGELKARPISTESQSNRRATAVEVLNGIDVLEKNRFAPLRGLRVGLITNQTGHNKNRRSTVDLLRDAPGVQLKALFSPEHGLKGTADSKVPDGVDGRTGLPVYSLYGETRQPRPEQLKNLDALVFDVQDIGCRFYTYISTMGLAMESAAKLGLKFFVLDRVNPIGGIVVDGPVHKGTSTFTAFHTIPVIHGMTVGELAKMFNDERNLNCDLTVIKVEGWKRSMWFDETGLPWTNPSPNMRSLTEAALYPGVGLLETTALSVGRGTGTPFEVIGAPYIDDIKLAAELNRVGLPGVRFVPVRFTPTASVFKDRECGGVQIILTDRYTCRVLDIGLVIAQKLHQLYPKEFDLEKFVNLLTHRPTLEAVRAGKSLSEIRDLWTTDLADFIKRRAKVLLYD